MQNVKDSPHFECNVLNVLDAHRRIRISIVENGQDSLKEIEQPGFFDTESLDVRYEKLGSPKQQNNVSLSFFQLPHSCFCIKSAMNVSLGVAKWRMPNIKLLGCGTIAMKKT
jgi:hypothetical protein